MPVFMHYDGIDGDVTTAGHEKWIELQSVQYGFNRRVTNATSGGADREGTTPSVSDIVITKTTDGSTPNLTRAALGMGPGAEGKTVKIDFCKTDATHPEPYLQLELTNALVSSFTMSSSGERPMESLALNFTKIAVNNIGMGAANETGNPDRAEYDLTSQTGS